MSSRPARQSGADVVVDLLINPGSSRNQLIGVYQDRLKVAITSAPVQGRANEVLIRFLSKILSLPRGRLEIVRGFRSRRKTLLVKEVSLEAVVTRLDLAGDND